MFPSSLIDSHTLAFGVTRLMGKYGSFGVSNVRQWVKPAKLKGAIIGEFGTGKTSLLASFEGALIFNWDRSSTPTPKIDSIPPPAQFWPAMTPDGVTTDFDGKQITLNWSTSCAMKDRLVEAARKNEPRPETIVLDSATEMFNMLREATLIHFKKESWDEGRGDAMWEWLYQQYNTFVNDLRNAGYGVWVIMHIAPEYETAADGTKKTKWAFTTPPGFFKRFYGGFEMALEMQKSVEKVPVQGFNIIKTGAGETRIPTTTVEDRTVFTLIGENPERVSLYKRRICFPVKLRLGDKDMWATFEKAYLEAAVPPVAPAAATGNLSS